MEKNSQNYYNNWISMIFTKLAMLYPGIKKYRLCNVTGGRHLNIWRCKACMWWNSIPRMEAVKGSYVELKFFSRNRVWQYYACLTCDMPQLCKNTQRSFSPACVWSTRQSTKALRSASKRKEERKKFSVFSLLAKALQGLGSLGPLINMAALCQ